MGYEKICDLYVATPFLVERFFVAASVLCKTDNQSAQRKISKTKLENYNIKKVTKVPCDCIIVTKVTK